MRRDISKAHPKTVHADDGSNHRIKSFRPERADQLEYGIKTNLFNDKLSTTISLYNIKVSNRVSPDPANINNALQGGKVRSKGFEFELNASPFTGLHLIAGYSHNETEVIAGDEDDFYSEPGRSIGGQGPQNLANLWASYKFPNGKLHNLGIGFGGNYAGKYRVIDNSITGEFDLPSYLLLNAGLFYNLDHYRISFNLNNLTNKEYYIGYWSVNP
ncbi:TonB-dependent siderophore receptor [Parapedobacter tibetensis]|uniref:TonB-dependent siderophore receptor n=1 Tax=Parapedobacter tibetensis TaxID=2972951 RepID=UPI00214D6AB1|nr:TonB-dependent receptor [Parapedobacter tibetensis]